MKYCSVSSPITRSPFAELLTAVAQPNQRKLSCIQVQRMPGFCCCDREIAVNVLLSVRVVSRVDIRPSKKLVKPLLGNAARMNALSSGLLV